MRKYVTIGFVSLILILLTACGKTTYEIEGEVILDFEGYDGHGEAVLTVDQDSLFDNLVEAKELDDRGDQAFNSFVSGIEVQVTPAEELANGDEVELDLTYDEENSFDIELSLKESTLTVENLEPMTELSHDDIFGGIELHFEGVSPFLRATVTESSSSEVSGLFTYSIPEGTYENDEEIEITAEPQSDLLASGYEADESDFTKTIEVPTQEKFVETWDELNEEDQEYIVDEIHDYVIAKFDSKLQESMYSILEKGDRIINGNFVEENGKSEAIEQYFLYVKENQSPEADDEINSVRIVFENEITTGEYMFDDDLSHVTKDIHAVVGASHIMVDEDGALIRGEMQVSLPAKPDIDIETVRTNGIHQHVDIFTVDEFELD